MPRLSFQAAILAVIVIKCHACPDWCVAPRCSCQDLIPGLSSFLEGTLGIQRSGTGGYFKRAACTAGFSGRECTCGFSKTNIAYEKELECYLPEQPDFDKATLTITRTGSASRSILAGTFENAYEAAASKPTEFSSFDAPGKIWSVAKTASGSQLVGGVFGIRVKRVGDSEFTSVLTNSTLGGMVAIGNKVFAATEDGLYVSTNAGETWRPSPTDCEPYDNSTAAAPKPGDPKPPQEDRYCRAACSHLFLLDDGSLIAFYNGFGGAHHIQLQNGADPLLAESWVAFPSFQDGDTCQSAYCPTNDAAILGNYLYVAKTSLGLFRIDLVQPIVWEKVIIGQNSVDGNDLVAVALTKAGNQKLFASTDYGLYHTSDGETWKAVSEEGCSDDRKPPYPSPGMVHVKDSSGTNVIVFGTTTGPWAYKY